MKNLIYNKLMFKSALLVAVLFIASVSAHAGSYYVSKSGNNSSGASWASAWNELSQVNWSTVGSGSTLYVAAGTYTTCFPTVTISGITIKRATASDHGISEGWNGSLDGQVIVDHAPKYFLEVRGVSSFTFDGASHSPWKFREIGITGIGGQILLRNSSNVIIRNVELDGNSESTLDGGPEDGLRVTYCDNLVVEHCYIHDFRQYSIPKAAHEDAVQMPSGNHVIFRYNIFANCGMLLFLGDPSWGNQWVNDITIEHNLFYCESGIGRGTYTGIDLKGTNKNGADTTRIENNTFALRSDESSRRCLYFSTTGNSNRALTYFRNNIIYNSNIGDVAQAPYHSNNCYYNPFKPGDTLSETGGITSDPLFVNYANNDFHLQSTSPCINKGAKVGWLYDFDGKKIVGIPDMGCFEVVGKK
jgi:pectate lyase